MKRLLSFAQIRAQIRTWFSVFVLAVILSASAVSCGDKTLATLPTLDVEASYPAEELVLQDIADVEYVALETTDESLLSAYITVVHVDDEIIVVRSEGKLAFFDRKTGKALHSFDRTGRGPGEYSMTGSVAVDAAAGELFVTTMFERHLRIMAYDFQGKFLRTLDYDRGGLIWFSDTFHVYDGGHLFWYEKDLNIPTPYRLLSRTDTVSTFLPVEFPSRGDMKIWSSDDMILADGTTVSGQPFSIEINGTSVLKTSDGFVFAEPGVDTVYRWNRSNGRMTPILARTPSFASMKYPIAVYFPGQTDDYMFLHTVEERLIKGDDVFSSEIPQKRLIYDKAAGTFREYKFVNRDYPDGKEFILQGSVALPVGSYVDNFQAINLVDARERGILSGSLADLAATLKDDDNPVIMIVTLK